MSLLGNKVRRFYLVLSDRIFDVLFRQNYYNRNLDLII